MTYSQLRSVTMVVLLSPLAKIIHVECGDDPQLILCIILDCQLLLITFLPLGAL